MRQKLARIDGEIASAFDGLNTVAYRLHAALVHGGTAVNGHYWAFIYDPQRNVWFKHNDRNVVQVDESVVWSETTGAGSGSSSSGYCLIYLSDELAQRMWQHTLYFLRAAVYSDEIG
jgi:ubiquitin C-terminal hydrolase